MIETSKIEENLIKIINATTQAGREIYYALSLLPEGHPAEANLKLALFSLGISRPIQLGLSDSVLNKRDLKS